MKILVISDIHSNIVALEEVWKCESDCDMVVSAGDVVDCGPFPRECIDWMIDHDVKAVKSNHDAAVIREYDAKEKSPNWDAHNAKLLDAHHIQYLRSLPKNLIIKEFWGHPHGIVHMYKGYDTIDTMEEFDRFSKEQFGTPNDWPIKRIIFGHTHKRTYHELDNGMYWLNPGSISYRHGERIKGRADYMVFEDGKFIHKSTQFLNGKLYQAVASADVCQNAKNAAYSWW